MTREVSCFASRPHEAHEWVFIESTPTETSWCPGVPASADSSNGDDRGA